MHIEYLDPYTLSWPEGVFPLGSDALALGEFATVRRGWRVCDLGTGSGALLLLLARRAPDLALSAVERDPLAAQTARDNLAQNDLTGTVVAGDLRDRLLPAGQFDLVVSNPPYFPVNAGGSGGPERSEAFCTLEQLCRRIPGEIRGPLRPVSPAGAVGRHNLLPPGPRPGAQAPDPSLPQSKPRPLPPAGRGGETGQAGGESGDAPSRER